jgi:plastocyanin
MRRTASVLTALVIGGLALGVGRSDAGPDKIAFPAGFQQNLVLYTIADRYDVKQYRELFAPKEALDAARAGKPLAAGTVLVLVQYKAQVDAQGNLLKNDKGRFLKGDLIGYAVMEKRAGWGAEYPPELRNGEWEYAAFSVDGKLNEKANYKGCFECHKPHEARDFVISYPQIASAGQPMPVASAPPDAKPDVTITGFVFGPNKLTVAPGKPVTWLNTDDSPHQITLAGPGGARSPLLMKGQTHTQAFPTTGVYNYICGLHPNMKGTVEVQ